MPTTSSTIFLLILSVLLGLHRDWKCDLTFFEVALEKGNFGAS
jgi:hypothetical protein